jgi:hypothetical protein
MNCKVACETLGIPYEPDLQTFNEYSMKQVRKLYYKQCLLYHPDKNPGNDTAAEKFRAAHNAYEFVIQMKEAEGIHPGLYDVNSASRFNDILRLFLKEIGLDGVDGLDDSMLAEFIATAGRKGRQLLQQTVISVLDTDILVTLLSIIEEYRYILHISDDVYAETKAAIEQQLDKRKHTITLNPTIDDLFNHNVFVFYSEVLERKLYLPMWHPEMIYNIGKTRLVVKSIFPSAQELDDHFYVGDDNTIHAGIRRQVRDLMDTDNVTIRLGVYSFQIPVLELRIATEQEYVIVDRGIPLPNDTDIYNVTHLSDIIVTITLV